eukprot:COSAG01_NODE_1793_length_9215_cov_16.655002_11_plen_79_part_00
MWSDDGDFNGCGAGGVELRSEEEEGGSEDDSFLNDDDVSEDDGDGDYDSGAGVAGDGQLQLPDWDGLCSAITASVNIY